MTQMSQPYRTYVDSEGNPTTYFCIDGVHVQYWSIYFHHHGGSTGWEVLGSCDGSCRVEVAECVPSLIAAFKETGQLGKVVLHESPSDEELDSQAAEEDEFDDSAMLGDIVTQRWSCCGSMGTGHKYGPCPNCGAI